MGTYRFVLPRIWRWHIWHTTRSSDGQHYGLAYLMQDIASRGVTLEQLRSQPHGTIKRMHKRQVCVFCQRSGVHLTDDHIIPKAKGGTESLSNSAPACIQCNSSKSKKDLIEWWLWKGRTIVELSNIDRDLLNSYLRLQWQYLERSGLLDTAIPEYYQTALDEIKATLPPRYAEAFFAWQEADLQTTLV